MTNADIERGNKLTKEIEKLRYLKFCLTDTLKEPKPTEKAKRYILRLLNKKNNLYDVTHASAILFSGVGYGGVDIPVDKQFIEYIMAYFDKQLEDKEKELELL